MGVRRGREEGPKESLCLSFCTGEEEEEEVNKPLSCTWPEVRCVGGGMRHRKSKLVAMEDRPKKGIVYRYGYGSFCEKFYNFQRLS